MTPQEILNVKMASNDAQAGTIKEYLKKLLETLWEKGEGFSGKRPFGNSSWEHEIMNALSEAGIPDDMQSQSIFDAIDAL